MVLVSISLQVAQVRRSRPSSVVVGCWMTSQSLHSCSWVGWEELGSEEEGSSCEEEAPELWEDWLWEELPCPELCFEDWEDWEDCEVAEDEVFELDEEELVLPLEAELDEDTSDETGVSDELSLGWSPPPPQPVKALRERAVRTKRNDFLFMMSPLG